MGWTTTQLGGPHTGTPSAWLYGKEGSVHAVVQDAGPSAQQTGTITEYYLDGGGAWQG